MSGAAVLCGLGALRGGAGLVTVAAPKLVWPIVAGYEPSYLTVPLPDDAEGQLDPSAIPVVIELMEKNTACGLGPGLGQSETVSRLVSEALQRSTVPLVLDADGLNALAKQRSLLNWVRGTRPLIFTPHPGEFGRLVGKTTGEVQSRRQELAFDFARRHDLILVLKGNQTVVTDGRRLYVNRTGNPGLATGGTGDVLTGLVTAFLAQGLEPFAAAQLGVYVHGLAGDLAAGEVGPVALIATDLVRFLPAAIETLSPRE